MRAYRVALIGCRARGTQQARAITRHPRTELVAVCDLLPERLNEVGDRFGVSARYSDFDPDRWWQTREGTRTGIIEMQKLLLDVVRYPTS